MTHPTTTYCNPLRIPRMALIPNYFAGSADASSRPTSAYIHTVPAEADPVKHRGDT